MTGLTKGSLLAMFSVLVATALLTSQSKAGLDQRIEPGSLIGTGKNAIILPLKGTVVNADISGFGARVTVVQTFTNPSTTPIEAVYTFPLPADAAVDRMRMTVGDRIIDGQIKRREEARLIYETAKNQGRAAALLDQERPNIFTQSVANILPKSEVRIEISYVQLLRYENGQFEFNFPMGVGPRYLGNAPDPGKISPPVIPDKMRTGATISLNVHLDAGAPVQEVSSVLHEVTTKKIVMSDQPQTAGLRGNWVGAPGTIHYLIALKKKDEIPNKDFILHYRMATDTVQSALLAKYDPVKGGFFSLVLLPPKAPVRQQIANRELIYVIDQTGSQSGFPIAKSKELTLKLMDTMRPGDTFNVIGFTTGVNPLWKESRPNTAENRSIAKNFVNKLEANGGTDIRNAMEFAYSIKPDPDRLRLFIFNSDGYVGDDAEILKTVRLRHGDSRLFTFGIGNSVNRYLIDAMSEEGRGDSEIVTLQADSDEATSRFVQRTQSPILLNVAAKFEGIEVSDVLPSQIPDVFSNKPILIYGRYAAPGQGKLTLTGRMAGQPWSQTIDITFPSDKPGGESIPTIWARRMVDKLEREYSLGTRGVSNAQEGQNKVTDLALEYGIMSQYTSFVAVEQRVINIGGKQRTVHVPVEMADGVNGEMAGANYLNYGARYPVRSRNGSPMMISGLMGGGRNVGGGGGGFGGSAGGPAGKTQFNAGAPLKDMGGFGGFDGIAMSEKEIAKLPPADQKRIRDERRKFFFESKVAKALRTKTGSIEVEVWLKDLDAATIQKLKTLGVSVEIQDKSLKVVFGSCDAKALMELAQLDQVTRIEPIS